MPNSRSRSVMRLTWAVPVLPAKRNAGSSSLPWASMRSWLAVPWPEFTTLNMPSRIKPTLRGSKRREGAADLSRGGGGASSWRGVVEEAVARGRDRLGDVGRAVAALQPAMEFYVAELEMADAGQPSQGVDRLGFEGGQRRHHLVGRARRIDAGDRLVVQRPLRAFQELAPFALGDAAGEGVGIEAGLGDHRQHVASADVEHHHRAALMLLQALG